LLKQRLASVLVAGIVAAAPFVASVPADAASKKIGSSGVENRCYYSGYGLCLYYYHGMTTQAYWGTFDSVSNLAGKTFRSGTGTGSGQAVKNNATGMYCNYAVYPNKNTCFSFYNSGYMGNYDWEYEGEMGALSYTKNEDASVLVNVTITG
jgi:hypothetical protein